MSSRGTLTLRNYRCFGPLTEAELAELQVSNGVRGRRKGKDEIPGIVAGLVVLYCGSAVVGQNSMGRDRKPDGTLLDGHSRLICCGHNDGGKRPVSGGTSVVPVEKALLSYCSDQFNLTAITAGQDIAGALCEQLTAVKTEADEMQRQLDRVTEVTTRA